MEHLLATGSGVAASYRGELTDLVSWDERIQLGLREIDAQHKAGSAHNRFVMVQVLLWGQGINRHLPCMQSMFFVEIT